MIDFLDLNSWRKGLRPVTSSEYFSGRAGEFNPEGLFSEIIFGPVESKERKTTFSYIELHCFVIHPTAYQLLIRLDRRFELFLSTQESFSLDSKGTLQIDPDGVRGIENFIKMFPKIKFRGERSDREEYIKKLQDAYKKKTLFIDIVPVIPVSQRDIYQDKDGNWVSDPINDSYIKIIRRAIQSKSTPKGSSLYDLMNYEVQKVVIEHDKFIRKLIAKKSGLIRSQMLGKRSDFTGRSVITPGPDLKINEIGVPLRLAIPLFEPFIIYRIFNTKMLDRVELEKEVKAYTGLELSIDSMKVIFKAIKSGDEVPKKLFDMIYQATEVAIQGRAVLAKRDPALHAESVRAFSPKLVLGNTMQLCTLQVGGFNADFDGDTMAVYHPITNEAQQEIVQKMMRSESGDNEKSVNFEFGKEMSTGLYFITKDVKVNKSPVVVSEEDMEKATDPYIPVKYRGKNTTLGKALFNSAFPPDFPFFDGQVTKSIINSLIPKILSKYGQKQAIETFSKLERISFKFATLSAPSIDLSNIEIPQAIKELKKKLANATVEEAVALISQSEKLLAEHLKGSGLHDLIASGAGKGWDQIRQILVAKGLISDPQGNVLDPIPHSFADGLSSTQFFKAASGARKGIIDRVLNTAPSGYMSRKLAFVLNSVEIDRELKDCKTKRTLDIRLTSENIGRFTGRYIIEKGKLIEFIKDNYSSGSVINLRSPIFCESKKICHTCYGKLVERHRSPYAGVLAAQIIGEAGTQQIMRTFHTGGAVKVVKQDIINDILQNDPLTNKETILEHMAQDENTLVCKKNLTLIINIEDYPLKTDLRLDDETNTLYAKGAVAKVESADKIFNLILDYQVEFNTEEHVQTKETFKLTFKEGQTILNIPMQTDEMKAQLQYVERLLGGREIVKDANHLYLKLFNVYGKLRSMDSVHMEILLSQVLRDTDNLSIPARLGKKWNPTLINIKQIVFKTSFIQGLAFENINEAIKVGLITQEPEEASILEQVLTGTLIEKKGVRK
jgi:DNA-directed RNA polymerase beta' subunit